MMSLLSKNRIESLELTLRAPSVLLIALLLMMQGGYVQAAPTEKLDRTASAEVEFDLSFMRNAASIDLSHYAAKNVITAGDYVLDIFVNGVSAGRAEVRFTADEVGPDAQPCFDRALLLRAGVDVTQLALEKTTSSAVCLRLDRLIPDASAKMDFSALRLNLSIPQAALSRRARDYVNPELWSDGVSMAMLNYYFDAYSNSRTGGTQIYGGLEGGFNLQGWRFRHQGSLAFSQNGQREYQNIASYIQRDIPAWSAQLVLGDSYTSGDLFDSTSFRGVRLYSDDRMLPSSLRGYAPAIRGVANSNARVTITQNGVKLREMSVAPGAFEINDLYPTGYGGDLQVTITEADGAVRTFSVPYAAVPMALRVGQSRYSVTAGTVRNLANSQPFFCQATWQYGATNMVTGYGGLTLADGYRAGMLGAVLNTSWGHSVWMQRTQ